MSKNKRSYIIVIQDGSAAILRRFRITRRFLIGAAAGAGFLGSLGLVGGVLLPVVATGSWALYSRIDSLETRNLALAAEKERLEGASSELESRLAAMESEALRITALAGIAGTMPVPVTRPSGGPLGGGPDIDAPVVSGPVITDTGLGTDGVGLSGETATAESLLERADSLDRHFDVVEDELLQRADRLSSLPLMRPADGADGDRYGWRTDPFTGEKDFHKGLDILALYGAPVRAPTHGTVDFAGRESGYGLTVLLSHPFEIRTRYGHLSQIKVHAGQHVTRGQIIGYVGSTGRSVGAHLHYEILVDGRRVDPNRFLDAEPGAWVSDVAF